MVERLTIARLGRRGDGIADTPDGPVFVPFALPGEVVEVEAWPGHPDRRLPIKIAQASAERIAPICPHFGVCGGCALQHWATARYREWKRGLVIESLSQAGLDAPVDELIDAHGEGRRRAVLHARRGQRDVLKVGFAAPRAHQHRRHRPLPGPCAGARWRACRRLGDRRDDRDACASRSTSR